MMNMLHNVNLLPYSVQLGINLHAIPIRPPDVLLMLFESKFAKPLDRIIVWTFRVFFCIEGLPNILTQFDFAKTATCE